MLIKATEYEKLDARKLMDVYSESNYEIQALGGTKL